MEKDAESGSLQARRNPPGFLVDSKGTKKSSVQQGLSAETFRSAHIWM
jgi:hypothetical protein